MKLSIELVPRTLPKLEQELQAVTDHFPGVDTVNIPDLLKFETRSWQACACAKRFMNRAIPHLRAIDIDLNKPLAVAPFLQANSLHEVLVVAGDAPADMSRTVYDTSSVQVIRKLRRELPEVTVYAALDPYRQSFVAELAYAEQKLEAGAAGFFTQPFFDLRLLEMYTEFFRGVPVYWGVTTVTSESSLSYWRNRNKAVFPESFEPNLDWCRGFARDALCFAEKRDLSLYFMPIRASAVSFLKGVLV